MRLEDYDTGETYQAKVISNTRITPPAPADDVREVVLEVSHADFDYQIGQSIGVIIPGPFTHPSLNRAESYQVSLQHGHHFRLYTVADTPEKQDNEHPRIKICVRRCDYVDDYSGETYPGIASNVICDLSPGDSLTINGPFGIPWQLPADTNTDLLLVGMGTGIAPFRALVKHLYEILGGWDGQVWVLNLARDSAELLYMNERLDAFTRYNEHDSFLASSAVSPRPHWDAPISLTDSLEQQSERLMTLLRGERGTVFIAGREDVIGVLEQVVLEHLDIDEDWGQMKTNLQNAGRWQELVY